MPQNPASLVILYGEDELAISQRLSAVMDGMGDSAMAEVNTDRLDGRTASMSDLETAVRTLPFLSARRLVILFHPLARLANAGNKDKLLALLAGIAPTVTLVLVEYKFLTEERDRKEGKLHWLESWAVQAGDRVEMHACPLPRATEMPGRIQAMAKANQGQITPEAARQLAILVGENPRLADQELQKLLAYANYSRAIQLDDVQHLIEDRALGDIFTMVDAMGNRSAKQAVTMFHRLLEEQDASSIFGMVVRQFRLLLLAREVFDGRGQVKDVTDMARLPSFVVDKIIAQARRFSPERLEAIYHRLLEIDTAVKTGEIDADLALDTLIASISL